MTQLRIRMAKFLSVALIAPLFTVIFAVSSSTPAAHAWQNANAAVLQWGGNTADTGQRTAVDSSGNIYTVGTFEGSVDFDPSSGVTLLSAQGVTRDIFISKRDKDGNFVWARKIGSDGPDSVSSIAIDPSGNILVAGGFIGGNILVDSSVPAFAGTRYPATQNYMNDAFILKLSPTGGYIWHKMLVTTGEDMIRSIAVDGSGNIFATGSTWSTTGTNFGSLTGFTTTNVYADVFVAKIGSDGSDIWTGAFGSATNDFGTGIAIGSNGFIYVVGIISGAINADRMTYKGQAQGVFGITSSNMVFRSNAGATTGFVLQLDENGYRQWATTYGSTATATSGTSTINSATAFNGVTVDSAGNVLAYGNHTIQTTHLVSGGYMTVAANAGITTPVPFMVMLSKNKETPTDANSEGKQLWWTSFRSCGSSSINGAVFTGPLEFAVIGTFTNAADGTCTVWPAMMNPAVTITAVGGSDIFVLKYTETVMPGTTTPSLSLTPIAWQRTYSASSNDQGNDIAIDRDGYLYLTGTLNGTSMVVNVSPSATLTPPGGYANQDAFVLKLTGAGESALTTPQAPTGVSATLNGTSAIVSFTPPTNNGGSPITSYTVTAYSGGVAVSPAITVTANSSPITVPNLPAGTYTFGVVANNTFGAGKASAQSNAVTVETPRVPNAPGTPQVTLIDPVAPSTTPSFSIAFDYPTDPGTTAITTYTAILYINHVATAVTVNGSASPIIFALPATPAPSNSNPYTFKVTATNSVGTGPESPESNAITTSTTTQVPGAPTITAVSSSESTTAQVSLSGPTFVGSPHYSAYKITAYVNGVATNITTTVTTSSSSANAIISGLTTGVAYTFVANALNTYSSGSTQMTGVSAPSAASPSVTPQMPPLASLPTNVAATPTSGTAGTVTWTASSSGNPTSYTVTATPTNGGAPVTVTVNAPTTSASFTGLTTGLTYSISVVPNNVTGAGPAASGTLTMPSKPDAPTVTANTAVYDSSTATVTFTAPTFTGGSAIASYTLRAYTNGVAHAYTSYTSGATFNIHADNVVSTYTHIDSFTVTAINVMGVESPESNAVPMLPAQPGQTKAVKAGNTEITVSIADGLPLGTLTGVYDTLTIYAFTETATMVAAMAPMKSSPNNLDPVNSCVASAPSWTCTVTGLTDSTKYWFSARAFNSMGYGKNGGFDSSGVATATPTPQPPVAPTNAALTGSTGTSASISWAPPSSSGTGGAVTSYTIVATPLGGGTPVTSSPISAPATSGTVGSLVAGTSYTIAVYATNPGGSSAYSNSVGPVTAGSVPAAPTVVTTNPTGVTFVNGNYSIAFTPPATATPAVTSYTFTAISSTGETKTVTSSSLTSPYLFQGLPSTGSWSFTVTANNAVGASAPSAVATATRLNYKVVPFARTVKYGTPVFNFDFKILDESDQIVQDPTGYNAFWYGPTCGITPAYTPTTAMGTYTITCERSSSVPSAILSSYPKAGGDQFNLNSLSTTDTLTVIADTPSTPTGVTTTYSGTTASVAFTPGTNAVGATYTVTAYVNGIPTSLKASGTSSPIVVAGLTPGVTYSFGVAATTTFGTSSATTNGTSAVSTLSTAALLPKPKLYAVPDAQTAIQGSTAVSFTLKYQTVAFDTSTTNANPAAGNTGYVPATCNINPAYSATTAVGSYTITCSGGNGGSLFDLDYSYTNTLLVTASTAYPAAPSNVAATTTGTSGAVVTFTAPTTPVSSLPTSYSVVATPVGGGSPVVQTVAAPATSATFASLNPATPYTFKVVSVNSNGTSLPGMASLTTGGTAPTPPSGGGGGGYVAPVVTIPTAPTAVSAALGGTTGSNYAIVSFTPAATNGVTTSYTVTAQPGGITASGTGSPIRVNGLTPGVNYTFTVTATNSAGTSSASAASGAFVIPAPVTPNKPAGYIEIPPSTTPGSSPVLLNGTPITVPLTRNIGTSTLNFIAKDWSLALSAYAENGKVAPVGTALTLTGVQGANLAATGTGFAPNSAIALYMFSKVYTLGTHTTDTDGKFTFTDPVPMDLPVGLHTAQIAGYAPDGKIRTASVKILIKAAAGAKPTPTATPEPTPSETPATEPSVKNSASTKIFFNLNASFVDAKALATIKKFVMAVKKHAGPYKIVVTGVVEPTPVNPFPIEVLSKARAVAFAAKLKAAGLTGKYTIRGDGLADHKGPSARYAKVVVTWNA